MCYRSVAALLLSVVALLGLSTPALAETDCSFDREAVLSLDQQAFDQDMTVGWQAIALRGEPCIEVAADLIRDYRDVHDLEAEILYWHEGQLRAAAGQVQEAIELFEEARRPSADGTDWNLYVDATIAFLNQDRSALLAAREALAQLPPPAGSIGVPWPPNLNVIDMLIACFGQPYIQAYGRCEQ
jgi:hypothetical protein